MTATSAIGLRRFEMGRGQLFAQHSHGEHQLVWASSGTLMVDVGDRSWILPNALALWLPAGTPHASRALRESVMQGIYIDPAECEVDWSEPTVVAVPLLARELIARLAETLTHRERVHTETVLLEVLRPLGTEMLGVRLPGDARARAAAQLVLSDPGHAWSLDELGRRSGASARTLLRLFTRQTGMTFDQWRTRARLQAAMPLLADGQPLSRVAHSVGYSTPSSFVAAFRRTTGQTPAAYFSS